MPWSGIISWHSKTAEINERLAWTFGDPFYESPSKQSEAVPAAPLPVLTDLQKLQEALYLENSIFEEAVLWLEDHPDDQSAKDAIAISEMRLTQLERRLEKMRSDPEGA